MKKVLSVIMAALMLFSVVQFTAVTVLAEETTAADDPIGEAPVPEGWTLPGDAPVSGYKPYSVQCSYCGETHEGFFGIFITLLHMLLQGVKMIQQAANR